MMKLMQVCLVGLIFMLTACQSLPFGTTSSDVMLAKDISYSLQSVKSTDLSNELIHQVKYIGPEGESFDYLVQVSIEPHKNRLTFIATSLLGIPLISFEVEDDRVLNINKIAPKLPNAKRILADLQFMFWPLKSLGNSPYMNAIEHCETICLRQIFYKSRLIAEFSYKANKLEDELSFVNKVHGYKMQIKNL